MPRLRESKKRKLSTNPTIDCEVNEVDVLNEQKDIDDDTESIGWTSDSSVGSDLDEFDESIQDLLDDSEPPLNIESNSSYEYWGKFALHLQHCTLHCTLPKLTHYTADVPNSDINLFLLALIEAQHKHSCSNSCMTFFLRLCKKLNPSVKVASEWKNAKKFINKFGVKVQKFQICKQCVRYVNLMY